MVLVTLTAAALGGAVVPAVLWRRLRERVHRLVADRETGTQRRLNAPPHAEVFLNYVPKAFEFDVAMQRKVKNTRSFVTLRNGKNIFYQTFEPPDGQIDSVVVFFHGFGDHCDFTNALKARTMVNMGRIAAIGFDMPGHGRSDGMSAYIEDWMGFVDEVRETLLTHLLPLGRERWGESVKVFGMGESMGGGVLFSLLIKEPNLFDGAILVCPMLFVSRDLFPPWVVLQLFKHVGVRFLPTWPAAPNKDVAPLCFEDKTVVECMSNARFHKGINYTAPPRLATAYQLAFAASEWMREHVQDFNVPALIIHGAADRVTDPLVSKELYARMKHDDKQLLFPEGCWHADLFHGGPSKYNTVKQHFQEVVTWIQARSPRRPASPSKAR